MTSRFLLFLVAGAIAATVNIVARILLNYVVPFEVAVALAFPIALTVGFFLNRHYVFDADTGAVGGQYARFLMVNLVALGHVWVISVGLAGWVLPAIGYDYHRELVAHAIGVASPIFTSYFLHKFFTFRTRRI
ncbi:GtrA family protein [Ancylobacter sp. WKF20]|uniref:GtrA family protein n=1 Tax=Ancylobacter sp. WKF20 TaxID=3039801 RepID=UPI0024344E77|nr:GtrA family protein [Ancylobacter sp. WKF20]WGD28377.1 GtrA family protein [Ancylobacter sp. WKF20]